MLKTLTVENFALIENVAVEFGAGLNILTGETGAGKSILIEALGALGGKKIGAGKIRKGADFLRVEAIFSDGLHVARKVSRTGKNFCSADGKPITLAALKKIGAQLLDTHDQNKNLELLRAENIYKLIDDEKILAELKNFQRLWRELNSKKRSLEKKISARAENLQRLDFLRTKKLTRR